MGIIFHAMKWMWQHKNWPDFEYDSAALLEKEALFREEASKLIGAASIITEEQQQSFTIDLMSEEALKSSKIEAELLNRDSVISSLLQQFGLIPKRHLLGGDKEAGIAALMFNNYQTYDQPLSHNQLHQWHPCIVKPSILVKTVGDYRNSPNPMQVVSGHEGRAVVHYEAPPAAMVPVEMDSFVQWFNDTAPGGNKPLPALTRAGIAHLYFVAIHPFEDGNGRICRALSEKALAQSCGRPGLFALSHPIESNKKEYYKQLEITQKGTMDINIWLNYFAAVAIDATKYSHQLVRFIVEKTRLFDRVRGKINQRQEKALTRMLAEGMDGFKGGMSADKYMKATGAIPRTASRDLQSLVELGAFVMTGERKGTRYWLNLGPEFEGPMRAHLAERGAS